MKRLINELNMKLNWQIWNANISTCSERSCKFIIFIYYLIFIFIIILIFSFCGRNAVAARRAQCVSDRSHVCDWLKKHRGLSINNQIMVLRLFYWQIKAFIIRLYTHTVLVSLTPFIHLFPLANMQFMCLTLPRCSTQVKRHKRCR